MQPKPALLLESKQIAAKSIFICIVRQFRNSKNIIKTSKVFFSNIRKGQSPLNYFLSFIKYDKSAVAKAPQTVKALLFLCLYFRLKSAAYERRKSLRLPCTVCDARSKTLFKVFINVLRVRKPAKTFE